tara:strand:- start:872 stop:1663 length:792 start_codon:yes stop_codon:yes gene_type:complete
MSDILKKITDFKKKEILELKNSYNIKKSIDFSLKQEKPRGFLKTLIKSNKQGFGLIAEIKKASPSKGIIRENFYPEKIASDYKNSGANCLSILTDQKFFAGKNEYLQNVKVTTDLPILRKDFIVDEIQIYESRSIGADCILLIAACLDDDELKGFYDIAISLNMDVLIEVHNEFELDRVLILNPPMIGINNRNLKTMTVSLETSASLVKKIPQNILIVSESGFKSNKDLRFMESLGVKNFLIGETFMKSKDIQKSVKKMLHGD